MIKDFGSIYKTKYRFLKDNLKPFPIRNILTYTIPVDKEPKEIDGHLNRDYPAINITNINFLKMIDKVANSLVAMGVKKGDFVIMCQSNTPEAFYMDYALSKIGAIPSYVYPNITSDEMVHYIKEVDAKYIFALGEDNILSMIEDALSKCDSANEIKVISSSVIESFPGMFKMIAAKKTGPGKKFDKLKTIKWEEFINNGNSVKAKEVPYEKNALCSITHTSGTSSLPPYLPLTL